MLFSRERQSVKNRVTGQTTKEERAYGNPCYGEAIAGAPEAATTLSTAELTSSKMCLSANRARQTPYGKLTPWARAAVVELGTRRGRDRRVKEASLESLCNPSDEGKRMSFYFYFTEQERRFEKNVEIIYW